MRINRLSKIAAIAGLGFALAVPLAAIEYDPIFDFIPLGGRSLLSQVLEDAPASEVQTLLSAQRSREQWLEYLKESSDVFPAVEQLDDWDLHTLADYLYFNMPLPAEAVPSDPATAEWPALLPMDGRDMALDYCQSCHIITVTITQDRTREAWLGTMSNPSHVEIKLTEQQREALASYLVLNAGIPIDQVPEDLRAGGASY
jgi:hypothetical protein